jgi:peptide/nickel transport system substrate-binding protein
MRFPHSLLKLLLCLLALAMLAGACGDDDSGDDAGDDPADGEASDDASAVDDDSGDDASTDGESTIETEAGDLVIAIGGDETTLNPYTYVTGYPGYNLLMLLHDSLLDLDEANVPQPALATSWEISADGLTYTMQLRDDVTWHDGEPFDADDVAFTFDYVVDNTHPRWTPGVAAVAGVEVTSPTEVVITLTEASPDFPVRPLADMPILAEHVWSTVTDPQNSGEVENVGTGPYVFTEYTPDQSYRLDANPDYAMGTPAAASVNLAIIPEPATAFAALRAGEVDMVAPIVEPQLVAEFEADGGIDVISGPGFGSTMININAERAPLDRPEVRAAIADAIDPQALIDTVLLGTGTAPNPGFLHPDGPITVDPLTHTFDPTAAAASLDAIGAVAGDDGIRVLDGEPLDFELLVYADNPTRIRAAELVAEQLDEIGIAITVAPLDAETVDEAVWPGFDVANGRDYDLSMWGWSPPVQLDAGRFGSLVHSGPGVGFFNVVGIADADIDALVDEMNAAADADSRASSIAALQARIAEVRPFVVLYYADGVYAFRPEAYDGWVYQAGQGPLGKISLVTG